MKKQTVFCTVLAALLATSLVSCARTGNSEDTTLDTASGETETTSEEKELDSYFETEQESLSGGQTEEMSTEQMSETQNPPVLEQDVFTVKSDTGTSLNLVVQYSVKNNDGGTKTVEAKIGLESGALSVTSRNNANYLRIGDETYYFSTEAISYKGETKTTFDFGTHTFTVPDGQDTLDLKAVWYFNGVYSDKPIALIEIDSQIDIK